MRIMEIRIHDVATDGLPDMKILGGRVAFFWDSCLLSGWPVPRGNEGDEDLDVPGDEQTWEADHDGTYGRFGNVKYWIEFPVPMWEIDKR